VLKAEKSEEFQAETPRTSSPTVIKTRREVHATNALLHTTYASNVAHITQKAVAHDQEVLSATDRMIRQHQRSINESKHIRAETEAIFKEATANVDILENVMENLNILQSMQGPPTTQSVSKRAEVKAPNKVSTLSPTRATKPAEIPIKKVSKRPETEEVKAELEESTAQPLMARIPVEISTSRVSKRQEAKTELKESIAPPSAVHISHDILTKKVQPNAAHPALLKEVPVSVATKKVESIPPKLAVTQKSAKQTVKPQTVQEKHLPFERQLYENDFKAAVRKEQLTFASAQVQGAQGDLDVCKEEVNEKVVQILKRINTSFPSNSKAYSKLNQDVQTMDVKSVSRTIGEFKNTTIPSVEKKIVAFEEKKFVDERAIAELVDLRKQEDVMQASIDRHIASRRKQAQDRSDALEAQLTSLTDQINAMEQQIAAAKSTLTVSDVAQNIQSDDHRKEVEHMVIARRIATVILPNLIQALSNRDSERRRRLDDVYTSQLNLLDVKPVGEGITAVQQKLTAHVRRLARLYAEDLSYLWVVAADFRARCAKKSHSHEHRPTGGRSDLQALVAREGLAEADDLRRLCMVPEHMRQLLPELAFAGGGDRLVGYGWQGYAPTSLQFGGSGTAGNQDLADNRDSFVVQLQAVPFLSNKYTEHLLTPDRSDGPERQSLRDFLETVGGHKVIGALYMATVKRSGVFELGSSTNRSMVQLQGWSCAVANIDQRGLVLVLFQPLRLVMMVPIRHMDLGSTLSAQQKVVANLHDVSDVKQTRKRLMNKGFEKDDKFEFKQGNSIIWTARFGNDISSRILEGRRMFTLIQEGTNNGLRLELLDTEKANDPSGGALLTKKSSDISTQDILDYESTMLFQKVTIIDEQKQRYVCSMHYSPLHMPGLVLNAADMFGDNQNAAPNAGSQVQGRLEDYWVRKAGGTESVINAVRAVSKEGNARPKCIEWLRDYSRHPFPPKPRWSQESLSQLMCSLRGASVVPEQWSLPANSELRNDLEQSVSDECNALRVQLTTLTY